MNTSIIVAMISAGASVVTALIALVSSRTTRDEVVHRIETHNAVVDEKISNLQKSVEKHNNVLERVFVLETKVENLERGG